MKRIIYVSFTLLSFYLHPSEITTFKGINRAVYSTTLDSSIFTEKSIKTHFKEGDKEEFRFTTNIYDSVIFDIINLKSRTIKNLHFSSNLTPNITLKTINIFSQNRDYTDKLLHQGISLYKPGRIAFGGILLFNLSYYKARGYKSVIFNKLNLKYLSLENIIEISEKYISPNNKEQIPGFRIKSYLELKPFKYINLNFLYRYNDYHSYKDQNRSLKIIFNLPYNKLSLEGKVKTKNTKNHYIGEVLLKSKISNFTNAHSIEPNYINSIYYKGYNKTTFTFFNDYSVSATIKWEYIDKLNKTAEAGFKIVKKEWELRVNYTYPISDDSEPWSVNGTIKQKY